MVVKCKGFEGATSAVCVCVCVCRCVSSCMKLTHTYKCTCMWEESFYFCERVYSI